MNRTNIVPDEREAEAYEFGRFRFDAAQRMRFRDGEVLPLVPKAAETLHALRKHHARVVEKAERIRLVLPDCTVEEIGLARNVSTEVEESTFLRFPNFSEEPFAWWVAHASCGRHST